MNSERIKEIQQETAYPESRSVHQALLQVWNECEQEKKGNYTRQTIIDFATWLDKLIPSQRTSVWSKNGEHQGLFTMDSEQLFAKFEKQYTEPLVAGDIKTKMP